MQKPYLSRFCLSYFLAVLKKSHCRETLNSSMSMSSSLTIEAKYKPRSHAIITKSLVFLLFGRGESSCRKLTLLVFLVLCRRGLSSYFRGKSQSFSCLGAISTVAELAKPEDPFAKKRRTSSNLMKKYRSHPSRCGSNGAISKRHSSSNGSTGLRSHARSPRSHHHRYMKPLPSSKCFSVPELQEAAAF